MFVSINNVRVRFSERMMRENDEGLWWVSGMMEKGGGDILEGDEAGVI